MNNNSVYRKIILDARKKEIKIIRENSLKIEKAYKAAAKSMTKKAAAAAKGELDQMTTAVIHKELKKELNKLQKVLYQNNIDGMSQAAKAASRIQIDFFDQIGKKYGMDISARFGSVFGRIPTDVLKTINAGDFYKDNKGISKRIWVDIKKMDNDLQHMLNQAIIEKKGAADFAKDLEKYVKPGVKRPVDWEKTYGGISKKKVEYNSMRLARTSINHSYFETNRRSVAVNPYTDGMQWELSKQHYERQIIPFGPDECDDFAEQDDYGLGAGVFPPSEIPLPHPQCLCHQFGIVIKDLEDIGSELRGWLDGDENQMLDEWYSEHGEKFTAGS